VLRHYYSLPCQNRLQWKFDCFEVRHSDVFVLVVVSLFAVVVPVVGCVGRVFLKTLWIRKIFNIQ
jgi:hypothetical protein